MNKTRVFPRPCSNSVAIVVAATLMLPLFAACRRSGSPVDPPVDPPAQSTLRHVPAATHVGTTRKLPPGCQSERAVEGERMTCILERTVRGMAIHWTHVMVSTSPRYTSTSTLSADGQTVLTIDALYVARGKSKLPDIKIKQTYGAMIRGIHLANLSVSDGQVTGDIDGRRIIPFQLTAKSGPVALTFADGRPPPNADLEPALASALQELDREAMLPFAAVGVLPFQDDPGGSRQNGLLDDETPHCVACYRGCAKNVLSWVVPGAAELCLATCYIPIEGDCAEKSCSVASTCDSDQTCCGDVCCGPTNVCGNALGACCPKDFPVGCGDETKIICYPSGSQCCGATDACESGTVCQVIPGAPPGARPRCCPSDRTCDADCCSADQSCLRTASGKGVCCAGELCGDQCCVGTCVAGQCCPTQGGTAAATVCGNACCGPLERCIDPTHSLCCTPLKSCGAQCCGDTESCVAGSCCPQDRACGTVCCGAGMMCQDRVRGTCAPIPVTCPQGESPCFPRGEGTSPVSSATPICCPTGSACCAGPPATCCAPGGSRECNSASRQPPACRLPICASGKPNSFCRSNADCPGSFCPTLEAVTCRSECIQ